jgi:hypothetical protein
LVVLGQRIVAGHQILHGIQLQHLEADMVDTVTIMAELEVPLEVIRKLDVAQVQLEHQVKEMLEVEARVDLVCQAVAEEAEERQLLEA